MYGAALRYPSARLERPFSCGLSRSRSPGPVTVPPHLRVREAPGFPGRFPIRRVRRYSRSGPDRSTTKTPFREGGERRNPPPPRSEPLRRPEPDALDPGRGREGAARGAQGRREVVVGVGGREERRLELRGREVDPAL